MLRMGDEGLQGDAILCVFVLCVLAVEQACGGRKGNSSVLWQLGMCSIRHSGSHFPSDFTSGVAGGRVCSKELLPKALQAHLGQFGFALNMQSTEACLFPSCLYSPSSAQVSEAAAHDCISSFHRALWSRSCSWNKLSQSQQESGCV